MNDEPSIILYSQWINKRTKWNDLPLAPKHTDEEYEVAVRLGNHYAAELIGAKARIKELEAQIKHPQFLDQALNEGDGAYRP